jgi:hypothetical protein
VLISKVPFDIAFKDLLNEPEHHKDWMWVRLCASERSNR